MILSAARRMLLVFSAGYILLFFSEHVFWARFRPESDSLAGYLSTWIAYSLAGYAALAVISIFTVRRAAAVFLAGAVFGWLIEGVIVGTTYESLPLSISFTGLAWHAPISLCLGLWLIPAALGRRDSTIVPAAILIGLFFGAWAIHLNAEAAEYHASATEFVLFAAGTTAFLIPAYAVFTALRRSPVRIHPAEGVLLGLLALFFFSFQAVAQPVALCVLPVLLGATFLGLSQNRRRESEGSMLETPLPVVPRRNLAALFLIPLSAAAVYLPAVWIGVAIPTNIFFYLLLMPAGFLLYGASLYRMWRSGGKPAGVIPDRSG